MTPRVFLSYSHDSDAHKAWVRQLASRLRRGGVEVTLDQWQLRLGGDVVRFMDQGIRDADRVLMVCTANYVAKAEERKGGAGYEGMIVTGHVARNTDTIKFVPIVRDNAADPLLPAFLGQRLWVDFRDDGRFEQRLEDLLRELHGVPLHQPPPLGPNPFADPAGPAPPGRGDFVSSGDSVVSEESVGSRTSVVRGTSLGSGESLGSGVSLAGEESARGVDPFGGDPIGGDPDGGGGSVGGGEAAGCGPEAGRCEPAGPGPVIGGREAAAREPVVGRREDAGPGAVIGSGDSARCEPVVGRREAAGPGPVIGSGDSARRESVVGGRDAAGPGPVVGGRPQPGAHAAEQGSSASEPQAPKAAASDSPSAPQAPKPAAFASPSASSTAPPSTPSSAPPFTPPSALPASPSPSAPPAAPLTTPPSDPAPPLTPSAAASPQPLALRPLTVTSAARLRVEGNLWGKRWTFDDHEVNVQACDLELGEGESLRLIQIPAGEFLMGSPASEPQRFDDEGPQHRVRLGSFLLGQTPVTQAQWKLVAGWPKLKLDLSANPSRFKDARRPVEQVNWLEAMEFCHRLSRRSGHVSAWPVRHSGNMHVRRARLRRLPLARRLRQSWSTTTVVSPMSMVRRGSVDNKPPLLRVFPLIRGDCTICTAMCGNGASITGIPTIKARPPMAVPGWMAKA